MPNNAAPGGEHSLFVDTNILLHYPPIDKIDWCSLCGAGTVSVVLSMPVIHEIDDKKKDYLLKDRAARVIRDIERIAEHGSKISDAVILELEHEDVAEHDLPEGFSPQSNDDIIIARALRHRERAPNRHVAIVTEDLGMKVKCKARGLPFFTPAAALRLPDPADANAKRVAKLQEDVVRLSKALPDLSIVVTQDGDETPDRILTVAFIGGEPSPPVEYLIERARRQFPKRSQARESWPANINLIPADEYERYNREVDEYLAAFPKYVERAAHYCEQMQRTFAVELWVLNKGGTPAEDVDVEITFDAPVLLSDLAMTRTLRPPKEPEPPKGTLERISEGPTWQSMIPMLGDRFAPERDRASFTVEGQSASGHVPSIKHHFRRKLGALTVSFREATDIGSFNASYVITAGNRPDQQAGRIDFIVPSTTNDTE